MRNFLNYEGAVWINGAQVVTPANIPFTRIEFDNIGALSLALPTRITIPKGIRLVEFGCLAFWSTNIWNAAEMTLMRNGASFITFSHGQAAGARTVPNFISRPVLVSEGDFFEFRAMGGPSGAQTGATVLAGAQFFMNVLERE